MKEIINSDEIENESNLVNYTLEDGLLCYTYTYTDRGNSKHDVTVKWKRPITSDIIHLLRKDVILEKEMAAINLYLMGKDEEFDKDFTSPNHYNSTARRRFILSDELRELVEQPTGEEHTVMYYITRNHVHIERKDGMFYFYRNFHKFLGRVLEREYSNRVLFESMGCHDEDMLALADYVDNNIVIRNFVSSPILRPKLYRDPQKTSDFIYLSEKVFTCKYKTPKWEYKRKYESFQKFVRDNPDFVI